jgi:hypothetical protein
MRVPVPEEVSRFIAARIAAYPTEAPEQLRWESPFVAAFNALPLYLGWTETIGIRPDGEFVQWSTEGDYSGVEPVEDRIWVLSALVEGARQYPQLQALLPERPSSAVDCQCLKHWLFASGKILCGECGGVGWLPR